MKKITLILAAMFAIAQMSAATPDAAVSSDASSADVATMAAADDDEKVYDHPFNKDDEETKHWKCTTSGFYLGMGVKHNWDAINNSFEVGLLNVIGLKYNSLHGQIITLGAGIHHRSYSIKRPVMLVRDDFSDAVIMSTYPSENVDHIKNRSSNLNIWTVQFPLMFRQRIVKKLEIGVAGILNWNTYARVDNRYEMDKVEHNTRYKGLKQEKVNFDFMGTLSWNGAGIYCRYSPGKFFKEGYGPEIKNTWTLGLTIGL